MKYRSDYIAKYTAKMQILNEWATSTTDPRLSWYYRGQIEVYREVISDLIPDHNGVKAGLE